MRDNLRKTLVVLVTLAAVGVILPTGGSRISAQSPDDQLRNMVHKLRSQ